MEKYNRVQVRDKVSIAAQKMFTNNIKVIPIQAVRVHKMICLMSGLICVASYLTVSENFLS